MESCFTLQKPALLAVALAFAVVLLAGCVGNPPAGGSGSNDYAVASPTLEATGSGSYGAQASANEGGYPSEPSIIPATGSVEPSSHKVLLAAVADMAEFNGKLYVLGSAGTSAIIYQYVDDKIAPKKVFTLGYQNSSDARFKDRPLGLNSLAVYHGVLYAGGDAGLFQIKQDGSWEYLGYSPSNAIAGTMGIIRLKVLGGEMYTGAYYGINTSNNPDGIFTHRVLKFTGSGWQEVPASYADVGIRLGISDLETAGGRLFVGAGSYDVYRYVTEGEGAPYFENLVGGYETDPNYANLDRFVMVGSDGQNLYACGEGAKLYKFGETTWKMLKEFSDDCEFFKLVDGALYVGIKGFGRTYGEPSLPGEMGLFKISGERVEQVAQVPLNNSKPIVLSVTSVEKHGGELVVGTVFNGGGGELYRIVDGKLVKLEYYE